MSAIVMQVYWEMLSSITLKKYLENSLCWERFTRASFGEETQIYSESGR